MLGILLLCVVVGWLNTAVGEVEERLWTIDIEAKDKPFGDEADLEVNLIDARGKWSQPVPSANVFLDWVPTRTLTEGTAADPASGVNDRPICRLTLKMTGEAEDVNKKIIAEACIDADKVETFFKCGVIKGGEGGTVAVNWSSIEALDWWRTVDTRSPRRRPSVPWLFPVFDKKDGNLTWDGDPGERISLTTAFFSEAQQWQTTYETVFNLESDTVCRESSKVFTPDERQKEVERLWDAALDSMSSSDISPLGSKADSQVFKELRPNAFCLRVLVFEPTKFEHKELRRLTPGVLLNVFSQGEGGGIFSRYGVVISKGSGFVECDAAPSHSGRVSERLAKRMIRKFRQKRKRRRNKKHVSRRGM